MSGWLQSGPRRHAAKTTLKISAAPQQHHHHQEHQLLTVPRQVRCYVATVPPRHDYVIRCESLLKSKVGVGAGRRRGGGWTEESNSISQRTNERKQRWAKPLCLRARVVLQETATVGGWQQAELSVVRVCVNGVCVFDDVFSSSSSFILCFTTTKLLPVGAESVSYTHLTLPTIYSV